MPIPTEITFRGLDSTASMEAKIRRWADKLETAYDGILDCEVLVEAPHRHHRHGQQYHVRVRVTVPGDELVVSRDPGRDDAHEDVYVAIRDSFRAMRRQVEDYVRRTLRRDVKTRAQEPTAS